MWAIVSCCAVALIVLSGCNSNPYLASAPNLPNGAVPPGGGYAGGVPPQITAQVAEYERRVRLLDDNNRQLTTQLAQSQQQVQIYRERSELLARQMQDVSGQLNQSRMAQTQTAEQVRGMQASLQKRGGAILTANNSLAQQAEALKSRGIPVKIEGDVIRISIPADQLFQPGTAQLAPNASTVLDPIAEAIVKQFSRQRVAIEGHSDNSPVYGGAYGSSHQLAAAQSMAVLEQFTRRNSIPANQLFSLSHGTNHPVSDNSSPAGRAQNRRIDIVVYPDTF